MGRKLDFEEAGEYLGMSAKWVRDLKDAGFLPFLVSVGVTPAAPRA